MSANSSNELSGYFRSEFPEISGDVLSRKLCTAEGIERAKNFEQRVYPLVGRHLSVRNRYFFEQCKLLIASGQFDTVLSLGSGLSLLTLLLRRNAPDLSYFDADLPEIVTQRKDKLTLLGADYSPDLEKIKLLNLDLEQASQAATSLQKEVESGRVLIILEGVSYFLTSVALKWLFNETERFRAGAIIFDYWPVSAFDSRTFRRMIDSFRTNISEAVQTTLSEAALCELSSLPMLEDISLQDAEKLYTSELQLSNFDEITPARFRILSNCCVL